MQKQLVQEKDGKGLSYILYLPEGKIEGKPLLVYLHGAGERGNHLEHVCRHAVPRLIDEGREYDAVVLCPQCPADAVWDNVTSRVKHTMDAVVQAYGIRRDRIVLTGSSMGGFGTWMMGVTYPAFFAGIAPVAGGGMSWRVENLRATPVFAVHGDVDDIVSPVYSQLMIEAMCRAGMTPEWRLLKGLGHNDGIEAAYERGEITDWLRSQRRTEFSCVPEAGEEMF